MCADLPRHHRPPTNSNQCISFGRKKGEEIDAPCSFPFSSCSLHLGSVQNLLELRYTMPHPRMHICFGALDMVMQVVTEKLDM